MLWHRPRSAGARTAGLLAAIAVAGLLAPASLAAQVRALHFRSAWDGAAVIPDAVVVVDGNRIVRVGRGIASAPAGAEVVDLTRYVGLPGLIDVHTHITYYWNREPGTNPRRQRRHPAVTVFLAQENARRTLESGVTTIRDLNASADMDQAMRDLVKMGKMTGPRMFVSGQGLSARQEPPGPARMAEMAKERLAAGDDWVKVFASRGGFEDVTTTRTLTYDEIKAAVDATHAAGARIAVHSYGPEAAKDAVRAGADSLEHGTDLDDETIAEMKRRGTVYVPTIDHNRYYIDAKDEYGFDPKAVPGLEAYIQRNLATARKAWAAGVTFAMGSDAVYTMFGQNTRELGWFVKAGMTPAEALTAATVNGARLLGQEAELGRLAPGYLADIIAVEGDPLADIEDVFTGVRWVMADGRVAVDGRAK
ncbi:MAG: amidohydrolase family protein [Vicinamibacterales bacterium]